jgi:hypothetical protein
MFELWHKKGVTLQLPKHIPTLNGRCVGIKRKNFQDPKLPSQLKELGVRIIK